MIDLERETLVTFAAAPRLIPAIDAVPGMEARKPLHERTIRNWATKGKCGVFLETISMGGVLVTSREAIARFFHRLTEARQQRVMVREQESLRNPSRHYARKRNPETARRLAAEHGV